MGNDRNIRNPVTAGHLTGGWAQQYAVVPSTIGEALASRGPPNVTQNSCCIGYGEPPLQAGSHGSPAAEGIWAAVVQKLDRRNTAGLVAAGNGVPPASHRNMGTWRPGAGA
ncbi:hypothetical protein C8R45DRAFT_947803 [Mycena sanguinolenta]|nr:hypothetical protein C8R45DRAFT_947803 [Mycena sanguinolenta]